jgi:hypothetical protein
MLLVNLIDVMSHDVNAKMHFKKYIGLGAAFIEARSQ